MLHFNNFYNKITGLINSRFVYAADKPAGKPVELDSVEDVYGNEEEETTLAELNKYIEEYEAKERSKKVAEEFTQTIQRNARKALKKGDEIAQLEPRKSSRGKGNEVTKIPAAKPLTKEERILAENIEIMEAEMEVNKFAKRVGLDKPIKRGGKGKEVTQVKPAESLDHQEYAIARFRERMEDVDSNDYALFVDNIAKGIIKLSKAYADAIKENPKDIFQARTSAEIMVFGTTEDANLEVVASLAEYAGFKAGDTAEQIAKKISNSISDSITNNMVAMRKEGKVGTGEWSEYRNRSTRLQSAIAQEIAKA